MDDIKTINIKLDEQSIEILKNVSPIHRDSVINIALSLVSKTGYYKTLTGKNQSDELDDTASLEIEDNESSSKSSKKDEPAKTKPVTSWDNF